ncbi:MAG: 3,4-dihydroxy-2-butanone-4-phosphate synthase [Planctomycetes bacterium]|nr:3,4-dihydroxy-2-butanone-4-phosphate synthase [Planctomycetota bacterium]
MPEVIEEFRCGRTVIILDDPDRENEGDLAVLAEAATPEAVNYMARHGRGLVCLALDGDIIDRLRIPMMQRTPGNRADTAFTVSIEARHGVTTGISAADRARTIQAAIADDASPEDIVTPGHVFPLRARKGGVLIRAGQTEASVDLARLAGKKPAAVICEIMSADGTMARVPELLEFARREDLAICTIRDLIEYRRQQETLVSRQDGVRLPTEFGDFDLYLYKSEVDDELHLALVKGLGELAEGSFRPHPEPILVRVHSQCLTGDLLGSRRCDCGAQMEEALRRIEKEGKGVFLYMRQEGRGIGLENKVKAYRLQDELGLDTVEANAALGLPTDMRDYGVGAQILHDLGVRRMRLLTNNPRKYEALAGYGLEILERVPLEIPPSRGNERYLRAKREKLGHLLSGL